MLEDLGQPWSEHGKIFFSANHNPDLIEKQQNMQGYWHKKNKENFTSWKEWDVKKSSSCFSCESNRTIWLGKDRFFANSAAKPTGSIMNLSDSSKTPFSSLLHSTSKPKLNFIRQVPKQKHQEEEKNLQYIPTFTTWASSPKIAWEGCDAE